MTNPTSVTTRDGERVFATVIGWPADLEPSVVADLLAKAGGIDVPTARLWAARSPPAVFGHLPRGVADTLVGALLAAGGDAIAPGLDDIEGLGPTRKVRDLRIGPAGLEIDLWREPPIVVAPDAVRVIVRGSVSERVRQLATPADGRCPQPILGDTAGFAMGLGTGMTTSIGVLGAFGLARVFEGGYVATLGMARGWAAVPKRPVPSEKLDLHVDGEGILQIDGDKFGFRVLGEDRAMSDNRNVDLMCELFTSLAPNAIVDPYFELWKPPPAHDRIRLPGMIANNDDPAFAFYSRWVTLVYRYLV